ncbi:hypothetical protein [Devosia riboflavina]|uniref:hypothetical protein n=1 Tax=Devosia riboflavina TaxID=46914 RepID=UPI0014705E46|nr:hypothetical protein [Devosia riboflavina]
MAAVTKVAIINLRLRRPKKADTDRAILVPRMSSVARILEASNLIKYYNDLDRRHFHFFAMALKMRPMKSTPGTSFFSRGSSNENREGSLPSLPYIERRFRMRFT